MSTGEITKAQKKKRHPVTGEPVLVRLQPWFVGRIDDWRRNQEDIPSRAEALRRLAEIAMGGSNG